LMNIIGSESVAMMQSTGQTATHEASFTPTHVSTMMYATTVLRRGFYAGFKAKCGASIAHANPSSGDPMTQARHQISPELAALTLEDLAQRYTARFQDRTPDWNAFEDAKIEGYRRAQHRYIGAGASGKTTDTSVVPPGAFTLSVMHVPPGQGNASHTHEVEEVFFVLKGYLTAFLEDETGRRLDIRLAPWDCIACPAGVIHGYQNESLEPAWLQIMLGKGTPDLMGYTDQSLYDRRDAHLP
jgi:quercetin dioxygenase-like cupin family protein